MPGTGEPYVALTGWRVDFTTGSDHNIRQLSVRLQNINWDSSAVNFNARGCLDGHENPDNFAFQVWYVVARWR